MITLKNHMEVIVEALVKQHMPEIDMCQCEHCRLDAMALALNRLQPAYVVSDRGELFASIDATYLQNQVDAEIAVLNALQMVKDSPRH